MKWPWDKFGIQAVRAAPGATGGKPFRLHAEPEPPVERKTLILNYLHLKDGTGVCVQFYESLGRAVVVVDAESVKPLREDVRLASRYSGWDVEVISAAKLDRLKRTALHDFAAMDSISPELAQSLVDHGFFTFDDLSIIEPDVLMKLGKLDNQQADVMVQEAETKAQQRFKNPGQ